MLHRELENFGFLAFYFLLPPCALCHRLKSKFKKRALESKCSDLSLKTYKQRYSLALSILLKPHTLVLQIKNAFWTILESLVRTINPTHVIFFGDCRCAHKVIPFHRSASPLSQTMHGHSPSTHTYRLAWAGHSGWRWTSEQHLVCYTSQSCLPCCTTMYSPRLVEKLCQAIFPTLSF